MGAPWAPAYACLHLGLWEKKLSLARFLAHAISWARYIDDVLMIWTGSIDELHEFIQELNRNERNFHLTYNNHQTQIPFLDLNISIKNMISYHIYVQKRNCSKYHSACDQPSS